MPIAFVGGYCEEFATHRAMMPALLHAGADGVWIPTSEAEQGSPYASFEKVLALIRFARERWIPFLGTCGGFQHVTIEFARNVLGIVDGDSAEHTGGEGNCVVIPVVCPPLDRPGVAQTIWRRTSLFSPWQPLAPDRF